MPSREKIAQQAKKNLERKILAAIREFESATSVTIMRIDIEHSIDQYHKVRVSSVDASIRDVRPSTSV